MVNILIKIEYFEIGYPESITEFFKNHIKNPQEGGYI